MAESSPDFFEQMPKLLPALRNDAEIRARSNPQLDPDDIVQAVVCRAMERKDQFEGKSLEQFYAWLRRILANHVIDLHRDASREHTVPLGFEDALLDSVTGPSTRAMNNEIAETLKKALSKFPIHVQNALVWRDVDGLSLKEIAQRIGNGVTEQAVNGYLTRGRRSLRAYLKDKDAPAAPKAPRASAKAAAAPAEASAATDDAVIATDSDGSAVTTLHSAETSSPPVAVCEGATDSEPVVASADLSDSEPIVITEDAPAPDPVAADETANSDSVVASENSWSEEAASASASDSEANDS